MVNHKNMRRSLSAITRRQYIWFFVGLIAVVGIALISTVGSEPSQLWEEAGDTSVTPNAARTESPWFELLRTYDAQLPQLKTGSLQATQEEYKHLDYRHFIEHFQKILGLHQTPPRYLFSSLHNPAAYLEALESLQGFKEESGQMERALNHLEEKEKNIGIRIGTHIEQHSGILNEKNNYSVLPASLKMEISLPDNRFLEHVFVRWVDTDNAQVVSTELVALGGLAGDQQFTTRPAPEVEAGSYRVEVYGDSEDLELLAFTSLAVGKENQAVQRRR